ncbi:MAG: RNA polymerase-binding protein DksA [Alphaproteobacteria bacterium]|nr:RNA polymerase-binding protein DksA [Alphaproteobacteria bacterium]MBT5389376.1 RNA polymerase-binding protein DksA [Alphaproteobacteria bacterium]MBT5540555.1 RNA polymerase-binding protein DksA [Alphaproteobacteria bacterium]MBT5653897.1 RNA polymerase-binding protein DksA [Alphaproteobacteria bacterium]
MTETLPESAVLPPDYKPSKSEDYMSPKQLEYFRQKLLKWRSELLHESEETLHHLQEEDHFEPDMADRATSETNRSLELRTRDRERKLISKIDSALARVEEDTYGYCEETGDPIGLARLEARPIATLSLEAQERHERMEKTYRDE